MYLYVNAKFCTSSPMCTKFMCTHNSYWFSLKEYPRPRIIFDILKRSGVLFFRMYSNYIFYQKWTWSRQVWCHGFTLVMLCPSFTIYHLLWHFVLQNSYALILLLHPWRWNVKFTYLGQSSNTIQFNFKYCLKIERNSNHWSPLWIHDIGLACFKFAFATKCGNLKF